MLKKMLTAGAVALALGLGSGVATPAFASPSTNSNQTAVRYVVGTAYTQGFYLNHPELWPCGIDPYSSFALSGQSYLEVLATSSKEGVYYSLAQQTIAAYLNVMNGVVPDEQTMQALQTAMGYFATITPDTVLTKEEQAMGKSLIDVLTAFNEGKTAVGSTTVTCQMARELKIRQ